MKKTGQKVQGKIEADGAMRCACGKKLASVMGEGIGIACDRCGDVAEFSLREMKAAGLMRIADMLAAI